MTTEVTHYELTAQLEAAQTEIRELRSALRYGAAAVRALIAFGMEEQGQGAQAVQRVIGWAYANDDDDCIEEPT